MTRALAILLFLTLSLVGNACDCGSEGPFLKTNISSQVTVHIKVEQYIEENLKFRGSATVAIWAEVKEVLKGTETRKRIRIFGDNGVQCREYVSAFKPGEEYVMNLYSGGETDGDGSSESSADYAISSCGEYYLKVERDSVKGKIIITDFCLYDSSAVHWSMTELRKGLKDPLAYILPQKICNQTDIYLQVANMPEYKYGKDSLNNLIFERLKLNPKDHNRYVEYVFIDFVVLENGCLTAIQPSPSKYMSSVAEKYIHDMIAVLISTGCDWTPGTHFNKVLKVRLTYQFDLMEICKGRK